MFWIVRLLYCFVLMVLLDLLSGVFGLALTKFDSLKYPVLYRVGLRCLAMSTFLCKRFLPDRCTLSGSGRSCGNWTCPRYRTCSGMK